MVFHFTRTKKVTDPLDDEAKARILKKTGPDYVSSGSEYCADDLTFGFDAAESPPEIERDPPMLDSGGSIVDPVDLIKPIVDNDQRDEFGNSLAAHVRKAAQVFTPRVGSTHTKQSVRRNVMAYLKNCGYDAAICKTKWESCGGLAAGNYEFIDVVRAAGSPERYFVDLDFAAEFVIARPTECYRRLMQHLPAIFVGTGDELRQILKVASDAARRSLKSGGLHLPPWRRYRFMVNKWIGPYGRTANVFTASFSIASMAEKMGHGVKCRAVGFDAAVNGGGRFLIPAAARTR